MTDKTDSKEREALVREICRSVAELPDRNSPEDWPEAMLVTHEELADIVRASLAANAGSEPVAPAGAAVLCWVNEDELPEGLTQEAYSALFPYSKVDVVRMFPVFGPTAQAAPAGAGTWAHLKLMMEASAWDGTLQLSDALANIDDFAADHPSPPEGMVATDAMIDAGKKMLHNSNGRGAREKVERIFNAMISAAPPTSSADSGKGE